MNSAKYLADIAAGGRHVEQGVKSLFDLYGARIKMFFIRNRLSDADAADLLQETFIKVVRCAGQFRHDAKVSTWIWSIARNCLHDYWRSLHEHASVEQMQEQIGNAWELDMGLTTLDFEQQDLHRCVWSAFEGFSQRFPEQATALQLVVVEGWTMAELGEFLGRTSNATKEYISQCKKRLRPFLEHCRELLVT